MPESLDLNSMQRLLTIVLVVFFCVSCGEKIPEDVIPKKQMPGVLVDVHLADGQLASIPIDSARAYRDAYYQLIFDRHQIDSAMFGRSVRFYATRPHIMNELYAEVEKQLNAFNLAEQKAVEQKYLLQQRADSIRNARQRDSLHRIARDSLDFKRKRYLLFLNAPDSVYGKPDSLTFEKLQHRMLETIGLPKEPVASQLPTPPGNVPPTLPKQSPKSEERPVLRPPEMIR
ncbi:DUF4296 domain-containing protein [Parapedobacter deserti]|uniref:DUF4296 domain-containing protein n=1 Tax=Parapedobacter deserti TaxID=1912957 RepID=A0ABV7JHB0_9SPHI